MTARSRRRAETGAAIRASVAVQLLLDLKNSDPTALTAAEAIRHLLGFGDRLVEIRRRSLHELVLGRAGARRSDGRCPTSCRLPRADGGLLEPEQAARLGAHRRRTPRAGPGARPPGGGARQAGRFGRPEPVRARGTITCSSGRGAGATFPRTCPPALRLGLAGVRARANSGRCAGATGHRGRAQRLDARRSGQPARAREGLLFNPHAQDHRLFPGAVPVPLWAAAGAPRMSGANARTARRRPPSRGPIRTTGSDTDDRFHEECGLRHLRPRQRGRLDLLRPLRPPAPRAGGGRHRRAQRREDPGPSGTRPGLRHLPRDDPRARWTATWGSGTTATPRRERRRSCATCSRSWSTTRAGSSRSPTTAT